MKIFEVKFSVKDCLYESSRRDKALWVVATSIEQAAKKGKRHARRTFDDKRARLEAVEFVGTVDVA